MLLLSYLWSIIVLNKLNNLSTVFFIKKEKISVCLFRDLNPYYPAYYQLIYRLGFGSEILYSVLVINIVPFLSLDSVSTSQDFSLCRILMVFVSNLWFLWLLVNIRKFCFALLCGCCCYFNVSFVNFVTVLFKLAKIYKYTFCFFLWSIKIKSSNIQAAIGFGDFKKDFRALFRFATVLGRFCCCKQQFLNPFFNAIKTFFFLFLGIGFDGIKLNHRLKTILRRYWNSWMEKKKISVISSLEFCLHFPIITDIFLIFS